MFNPEDRESIVNMIHSKRNDAYVVPMYVKIYNNTYLLSEMDQIQNFNPAGFKVGFGASISALDATSFPSQFLCDFEYVSVFSEYDSEIETNVKYFVFETRAIESDNKHPMHEQMAYYFNLLKDHLTVQQNEIRRKIMEEEDVDSQS